MNNKETSKSHNDEPTNDDKNSLWKGMSAIFFMIALICALFVFARGGFRI